MSDFPARRKFSTGQFASKAGLLDERESSYRDSIPADDGTLFIIYDHQRYTLNRAGKRGVDSVVMTSSSGNSCFATFSAVLDTN